MIAAVIRASVTGRFLVLMAAVALLAAGLPPVTANATNAVGL